MEATVKNINKRVSFDATQIRKALEASLPKEVTENNPIFFQFTPETGKFSASSLNAAASNDISDSETEDNESGPITYIF